MPGKIQVDTGTIPFRRGETVYKILVFLVLHIFYLSEIFLPFVNDFISCQEVKSFKKGKNISDR